MSGKLTVQEVLDMETGKITPAELILSKPDSTHHKQRMADEIAKIRQAAVRYHCPLCLEPLSIRGLQDQTFYFRHPNNPGAECPYRYEHNLTADQINAMKYDGAKESARHKNIKGIIQKSLLSDRDIDPDSVMLEQRVKHTTEDWTQWRQPDVQAKIKEKLFVFEIQLSTTFLAVVAGRREFYLKKGAMLIWIFDEELMSGRDMRFTERDVYHNNNRNLFYVNSNTLESSIENSEFRLMCQWEEPRLEAGKIQYITHEKEISISELTLDFSNQRAYYFDFDHRENELQKKWNAIQTAAKNSFDLNKVESLEDSLNDWFDYEDDDNNDPITELEILRAKRAAEADAYRADILEKYGMPAPDILTAANFSQYWIRAASEDNREKNQEAVWSHYYPALINICPNLPRSLPKEYRHLLCALYSLREGKVIGSDLDNLRALENHIYAHYRYFYRYFAFAIRSYAREEELKCSIAGSTCYNHHQEYRNNRGKTKFVQNRAPDQLIMFLFPELA